MTIKEQEDKLFSEWKAHRNHFVADGVADENIYLESGKGGGKKILFIMKEVNDPEGGGWDLREVMREGKRSATWDNIARWTLGIRNLDRDISWKELNEKMLLGSKKEAIRSVAAMNLKKSPGGSATDKALMEKIAREDMDFLERQVEFYDPDIVICCGVDVSYLAHTCIKILSHPMWKATSRGVPYHELGTPKKTLISYSHPEARVSDNLLYYGLIDAIREIYQEKSGG